MKKKNIITLNIDLAITVLHVILFNKYEILKSNNKMNLVKLVQLFQLLPRSLNVLIYIININRLLFVPYISEIYSFIFPNYLTPNH
ncbi:hypothetical protein A3Q33_15045 [Colwellia sp. PAMC 21821]|nr:hypothetical protein A3Q33_15045 [Colwellia sp. PAMC 21821]